MQVTYGGMCTIGNAESKLEDHQQKDIGILDDLCNLFPLELVALHTSLVASNAVNSVNSLLFIEEAGTIGSIGEKNGQDNSPNESDETEDDEQPLKHVSEHWLRDGMDEWLTYPPGRKSSANMSNPICARKSVV